MSKPTGPFDGKPTTYCFGRRNTRQFKVEGATSLAKAIRAFRVGAMFPHQYSSAPIATRQLGKDGYEKDFYLASAPGAYVSVYVYERSNRDPSVDPEIARIPIEAAADEDFDPEILEHVSGSVMGFLGTAGSSESTALATGGALTGLRGTHRRELEQQQLQIERMMGELEHQKREMLAQVNAMKAELERRMEQIWMIELFLGSKEEVLVLREGEPAPVDTPITVRQRVLCMDEEIAVYDWLHNPDRLGQFDYTHIDGFDQWLLADPAHLHTIFPHEKGVVALRIRRHEKARRVASIADAFAAAQEAEADKMTYLLVRNGEQLYRLWVDIKLWPRMFASEADAAKLVVSDGAFADYKRRDAEAQMKRYMAGLLCIEGLLQRSTLLHPLPERERIRLGSGIQQQISVFDPEDVEEHFQLLRDDEGQMLLADDNDGLAHVTWDAYRKWLKSKIDVGVRVQCFPVHSRDDDLYHRTGNKSLCTWPDEAEVYTLDRKEDRSWSYYHWSFLYLPNETIWDRDAWEERGRVRRVRFCCYPEELMPVDYISWRVVEHLLLDRGQREHYGRFFGRLFRWHNAKKAEAVAERPFVDLVLMQCGASLDDEHERARVERLVRWWKIKTQMHRTISDDEAKALRMICKAYRAGKDVDDDPEKQLLAHLKRKTTPMETSC